MAAMRIPNRAPQQRPTQSFKLRRRARDSQPAVQGIIINAPSNMPTGVQQYLALQDKHNVKSRNLANYIDTWV